MRYSHLLIVLGSAVGALGCGGPAPDPYTRAIIQDWSQWSVSGLSGEISTPLYPVSISSTLQAISYSGTFEGISSYGAPTRYVTGSLQAKFFGYSGPFNLSGGDWTTWLDYSADGTWSWFNHPTDFTKMRSTPTGNYPAGYNGLSDRRDRVFARARMYHTSNGYYDAIGHAWLPWKFTSEAGLMIGSATQALKDAPVWFQTSADLPGPITYAWTLNGVPQGGWTTDFVTTSFSTTGSKYIGVTMTGSNSAQVNTSWLVGIICPGGGIFC